MPITPHQKFTAPFICQGNHIIDHIRDILADPFEVTKTKKEIMQALTPELCEEYTKNMLAITEEIRYDESLDDYFVERDNLAVRIAVKAKLITEKQVKDSGIELL